MPNHNPPVAGFKKGKSGNPKGRPKREWTWSGLLKRILEEKEPKSGKQWKSLVSRALILRAASGDTNAIKALFYQMEGFPQQRTDITTGGKPIPILSNLHEIHNNNSDKEN